MRAPTQHDREPPELKMTPMIDVVFLLLIFFLWTSSFETPEFALPSAFAEPPSAGTRVASETPPELLDELIIRLVAGNPQQPPSIFLNDQPFASATLLAQRLKAIIDIGALPPVIIDPDENVPVGEAIEIYDLARQTGFDRVMLTASSDV